MSGNYVFSAIDGGTRVVHRSAGSPGPMYPTWLIRKANQSSTITMTESMRRQALESE